jgi:hypothetical protein
VRAFPDHPAVACTLIATLLLWGCSTQGAESSSEDGALSKSVPTASHVAAEVPAPHSPSKDVSKTPPSFAEYHEAMTETVDCLSKHGFNVEGPISADSNILVVEPGGDPRLRLSYVTEVSDAQLPDFDRVDAQCRQAFLTRIEEAYLDSIEPTDAEIERWLDRAWSCVENFGLIADKTVETAMRSVVDGCRPWEYGERS